MLENNKRVKSWQEQLVERLDNEVHGDCAYQIRWLILHLGQYLERWLGFAELDNLSVAATLNSDVFCVALAAISLTDSRIAQLSSTISFPREEWDCFRNTLEWIQREPDRSELKLVIDTFESFRQKLSDS